MFEKPLIRYSPEDIIDSKLNVSFASKLNPVYFFSLTIIEEDNLLISEIETSSTFISTSSLVSILLSITSSVIILFK